MKRILLALAIFLPLSAQAAHPIVADLAMRGIEIDTSFTGIDILLFGARDEAGDVVVVVRGPKRDYVVRKKERTMGIWMTRGQKKLSDVSSFYAVSSSRPVARIDNGYLLTALGLGADNWGWRGEKSERLNKNDDFAEALYRIKKETGLYAEEEKVSFWGDTLFRTNLRFPANIEGGTYLAEVYLFSGGRLVSVQSTPIHVKKIGFEAFTYEFAHEHAVLYGLSAIFLALFAGWLASVVFRRA